MGNNQLFDLVHSLTQSEKRYFKLMAAQQSGEDKSDGVKLFDALCKQSIYDEFLLKKKFKGSGVEKRFSALKIYLYDLILKSLAQYNNQSFASIKIRKYLDEGEVLQRKGLYAHAIKRLEKAEKLADEAGASFVLHDILRLKLSCQSMIGSFPSTYEEMNGQLARLDEEMLKMNQTNFIFTKSISLVHWCMHLKGKKGNAVELKNIIDDTFIHLEKSLCGRFNQHYYYRTLKMYYDEAGNNEMWFKSVLKHVQIFEEDVAFLNRLPSNYFHALSSVLNYYVSTKNEAAAEKIMMKAKSFLENNNAMYTNKTNDCAHLFCTYFNMLLRGGDTLKIAAYRTQLLTQYNEGKGVINLYARLWIKHLLALSYMKETNWKEALKWNNLLIHHDQFGKSNFLYFEGYLQNILLHYHLKNYDYIERLSKSVFKIVGSDQDMSSQEKSLLLFFHQIGKNQNFIGDQKQLLSDCAVLQERNHFIYDFLQNWMSDLCSITVSQNVSSI